MNPSTLQPWNPITELLVDSFITCSDVSTFYKFMILTQLTANVYDHCNTDLHRNGGGGNPADSAGMGTHFVEMQCSYDGNRICRNPAWTEFLSMREPCGNALKILLTIEIQVQALEY